MSKETLLAEAKEALADFDAKALEEKAVGILVFPKVIKGGFGFGGQYGQGVLFQKGEDKGFYDLITLSVGWQLGLQKRTMLFYFMTDEALESFQKSGGWKVGVDASVSVITADTGLEIGSDEMLNPILAIVTDREGLMYNLSLEGTKISPIVKR